MGSSLKTMKLQIGYNCQPKDTFSKKDREILLMRKRLERKKIKKIHISRSKQANRRMVETILTKIIEGAYDTSKVDKKIKKYKGEIKLQKGNWTRLIDGGNSSSTFKDHFDKYYSKCPEDEKKRNIRTI